MGENFAFVSPLNLAVDEKFKWRKQTFDGLEEAAGRQEEAKSAESTKMNINREEREKRFIF